MLGLGFLTAAPALLHGSGARNQEGKQAELLPGAEGLLSNDCFLPTAPNAKVRLIGGDAVLKRARAAAEERPEEASRLYIECFDAWHESLGLGKANASVWVRLNNGPERTLTEGVGYAVRRRLQNLSAPELALWTERVEALARPSLVAAASDAQELKHLERQYPSTRSAVQAGLLLADMALERGAFSEAGTWLGRAQDNLPRPAPEDPLRMAIERRILRLPKPVLQPGWDSAAAFEVVSAMQFGLDERQPAADLGAQSAPMRGPRPGLVFLSKTRLAVQTERQIHLFRLTPRGVLSSERAFDCSSLRFANGAGLPFDLPSFEYRRARRAPGWQFTPAAAGDDLFVVSGQAAQEGLPNALLSIALPPTLLPGSLNLPGQAQAPRLNWAVLGNEWVDRDGNSTAMELLADLEDIEFQPGPLVEENRVVVQARSFGDVVSSWLMCFDRHSGQLQWRHLLGTGSELLEDQGRLGSGNTPRLSAPPLTLVSGPKGLGKRVFVSTNLGFGALVDQLDGRPIWCIKNRRRAHADLGWDGYAALLNASGEQDTLWWAAFDSDRLYALRPEELIGEDVGRESLLVEHPLPIGESRTLLGADKLGIVVQGRAGRERTISSLSVDAKRGSMRVDALYLGPGEEFLGRGLVSATRVLACSERGLYLFDRTRELYLLGYTALPRPLGSRNWGPGGDLFAQDGLIFAVGKNGIWSFRPN